jgi:hypothetical protein
MQRIFINKWDNRQNTSMLLVSTHWQSDETSVSMLVDDISRNKCFPVSNITCSMLYIHLWPINWLSLVVWRETDVSEEYNACISGSKSKPKKKPAEAGGRFGSAHGVKPQKTVHFIDTAVRTSNPTRPRTNVAATSWVLTMNVVCRKQTSDL